MSRLTFRQPEILLRPACSWSRHDRSVICLVTFSGDPPELQFDCPRLQVPIFLRVCRIPACIRRGCLSVLPSHGLALTLVSSGRLRFWISGSSGPAFRSSLRITLSSSISACSGSISHSSGLSVSSISFAIGCYRPVGLLFVGVRHLTLLFAFSYFCLGGKVRISSFESGDHIVFVEFLVLITCFVALPAFLSPIFCFSSVVFP